MIIILEPSNQYKMMKQHLLALFRVLSSKRNEPHLCRQKMNINFTRQLTCLTVPVCISRFTRASVTSREILTSSTVLTRGLSTFIDIQITNLKSKELQTRLYLKPPFPFVCLQPMDKTISNKILLNMKILRSLFGCNQKDISSRNTTITSLQTCRILFFFSKQSRTLIKYVSKCKINEINSFQRCFQKFILLNGQNGEKQWN